MRREPNRSEGNIKTVNRREKESPWLPGMRAQLHSFTGAFMCDVEIVSVLPNIDQCVVRLPKGEQHTVAESRLRGS